MLALAGDVQYIQTIMQEVELLQNSLSREDSDIAPRSIELRQTIKKLMTSPQFMEALGRLEIQGSPVWGLSSAERELIIHAREIVNECWECESGVIMNEGFDEVWARRERGKVIS